MSRWQAGSFQIATVTGVATMQGYVDSGLGLWLLSPASPKGRRKARWSLTHLGSGHRVCEISGDVRTAFPIATEIADAGDWTFDGLTGFQNQFPDAAEKLREILGRHARLAKRDNKPGFSSEEQAREIAMSRA